MQVRFILLSHTWVAYRPVVSSPQMSRRWRLLSNKLSVGLLTCVRRSLYVSLHASVDLFTSVSWSLQLVSVHTTRTLNNNRNDASHHSQWNRCPPQALQHCGTCLPNAKTFNAHCNTRTKTHTLCVYTRVYCVCKHEGNKYTFFSLHLFGAGLAFGGLTWIFFKNKIKFFTKNK